MKTTTFEKVLAYQLADSAEFFYLDYVNNFLTVAAFAEYYGETEATAIKLIETERAKQ